MGIKGRKTKWVNCIYCGRVTDERSIKRHTNTCVSNPETISKRKKECPICGKSFISKSVTCSYACANAHFRSGENHGNWKESTYKTTCFAYHKKECVVCGELNIVEVHHYDENHNNNSHENLIPLCPTHHQYFHSRFKYIVVDKITEYRNKYIGTDQTNIL